MEVAAKRNVVLFVDDESHILSAIRRATGDENFESLFAGSGIEALQICERREVSVIVTDMRMPVMDGLTLLKIVRGKYPRTVRMVLSGYTQLSQVLVTINQGEIFQFIPKPWEMEAELLWAVRRAVERYNIEIERDSLQEGLAKKNNAYVRILHEMEQKLANERRDIDGFKNISRWMFSFWKDHLETCAIDPLGEPTELADQFKWLEKIQTAYMDVLPTSFEGRTLAVIETDINKACSGRIEFRGATNDEQVFWGYQTFMTMVFKIIVDLHSPEEENTVPVSGLIETRDDGAVFAVFDSRPSAAAVQNQTILMICYSLLDAIGQSYNLRLVPKRTNGKIDRVQMIWQSQIQANQAIGEISDTSDNGQEK